MSTLHHQFLSQCTALRDAVVRGAWEEADAIAKALTALIEIEQQQNVSDEASRRAFMRQALELLEEARAHLSPAHASLAKLLSAWQHSKPRG
ncbi:MAG: hypothetical protein N2557_02860 [Hydrogenophilus sp.]|nr:hypothetical protein [Hydrogenophilus sp.]